MKIVGPIDSFDKGNEISRSNKAKGKETIYEKEKKYSQKEEGRTDSVSLSSFAREVSKTTSKVLEAPDIREELVDEIKTRLEKGEYKVDSSKVADKIVLDAFKDSTPI